MKNNQQQLPSVALLVGVMLLFGVVWSHDSGLSRKGESSHRASVEVAINSAHTEEVESASPEFVAQYDSTDFAIPTLQSPGNFRLVNNRGFSTTVSLTVKEFTETGLEIDPTRKNLYEMEQNGIRWYYIRLDNSNHEAETSQTSSRVPVPPLVAPKPQRKVPLPQVLTSSFEIVRSSLSSGYRHAANSVKSAVDHLVRTPARIFERLTQAKRKAKAERFPDTNHLSAPGLDPEEILDSVFY